MTESREYRGWIAHGGVDQKSKAENDEWIWQHGFFRK